MVKDTYSQSWFGWNSEEQQQQHCKSSTQLGSTITCCCRVTSRSIHSSRISTPTSLRARPPTSQQHSCNPHAPMISDLPLQDLNLFVRSVSELLLFRTGILRVKKQLSDLSLTPPRLLFSSLILDVTQAHTIVCAHLGLSDALTLPPSPPPSPLPASIESNRKREKPNQPAPWLGETRSMEPDLCHLTSPPPGLVVTSSIYYQVVLMMENW